MRSIYCPSKLNERGETVEIGSAQELNKETVLPTTVMGSRLTELVMHGLERVHRVPGMAVQGTPVWAHDWDVLCVLDGLRVDTAREVVDESVGSYRSVGSTSREWLAETFPDHDLDKIAYLTGNPFANEEIPTDRLGYFHQEAVCETRFGVETVSPTPLRDRAVAAWRRRDDLGIDRLIVHFMQPHVPFRSRPEWFEEFLGTDTWGSSTWEAVVTGDIDREAWFNAYRDNLVWALEDGVDPLCERIDATVGVTADHGNAAGEWGIAGHPQTVAVPSVRRVPWWTRAATREVEDVPEMDLESSTAVDREKQLEALGYL